MHIKDLPCAFLGVLAVKRQDIISIHELGNDEITEILDTAEAFADGTKTQDLLRQRVVATLFFEPSTRTRLSFESAVSKLGGSVIGFSDAGSTSTKKGESLKDTIKMMEHYADIIILRHPREGAARFAAEVSSIPVINAGDGANQHPTQTLLDLFSIRRTQDRLDNLHIVLVGDLKYGRTVHSLVQALSRFNNRFTFVSPRELMIPPSIREELQHAGVTFHESDDLHTVLEDADILYVTRIQKERFSDPFEYERVKDFFVLRRDMLSGTKQNLKIMHPLPRVHEIHPDVDGCPQAYYFTQAANGVYVREALLSLLLEGKP